jgi:hypothetical protein
VLGRIRVELGEWDDHVDGSVYVDTAIDVYLDLEFRGPRDDGVMVEVIAERGGKLCGSRFF